MGTDLGTLGASINDDQMLPKFLCLNIYRQVHNFRERSIEAAHTHRHMFRPGREPTSWSLGLGFYSAFWLLHVSMHDGVCSTVWQV